MANLSKIMLPDGTTYDICDTTARSEIVGGNIWYATCTTAAGTAAKVATTSTGDFALATGSMVRVMFTNAFTYNGTSTLNVDSKGAKNITRVGTTTTTRYFVSAGEVVDFVYDGTNFVMSRTGIASTTYYGLTKLTTSAYSTNTSTALTPASLNNFAQYVATGLPIYSASSTYTRGDRVRYGNYMYECNEDIMTAEAWNANHWTALDPLLEQIDGKSSVSINRKTTSGTNIFDITIDGTTTSIYAPTGGGTTQVQSNWNETDTTSPAYIQNKPTIPTTTGELTNNSGFVTANDLYPVGSVYVTSTNSAPTFGGTWTLFDKEFTAVTASQISVGTSNENDFVLNSTNTTSMSAWVSRHGHSIYLSINAITFKVSVGGTNLALGTFKLPYLGAQYAVISPVIMGWSDGANAIIGMTLDRSTGALQSQNVVVRGTGTSIAAGSSAVFTVELPCDYTQMLDSFCNKFYWKRTA